MSRFTFTSESVSEGHPDKVADYISDSVLDACFEQDPKSRVACETLVKSDTVVLAGEITTNAQFDYDKIVRQAMITSNAPSAAETTAYARLPGPLSFVLIPSVVDSSGTAERTAYATVPASRRTAMLVNHEAISL